LNLKTKQKKGELVTSLISGRTDATQRISIEISRTADTLEGICLDMKGILDKL
jgi:hypothetical protein